MELQTIAVPKDEQKCKKRPLVPRFSLKLGESTATTCPEFSFTELAKKEKVSGQRTSNAKEMSAETLV